MSYHHEAQPELAELLPSPEDLTNQEYLDRSSHFGEAWTAYVTDPRRYDYEATHPNGEATDFFRDLGAVIDDAGIDNITEAASLRGLPYVDYKDMTTEGRTGRAAVGIWYAARQKGLVPDVMHTGSDGGVGYYNDRVGLNLVQARTIAASTAGERVLPPGLISAIYEGREGEFAYDGGTEDRIADQLTDIRRKYRTALVSGVVKPQDIVLGVISAQTIEDVQQHFLRMNNIANDDTIRTDEQRNPSTEQPAIVKESDSSND